MRSPCNSFQRWRENSPSWGQDYWCQGVLAVCAVLCLYVGVELYAMNDFDRIECRYRSFLVMFAVYQWWVVLVCRAVSSHMVVDKFIAIYNRPWQTERALFIFQNNGVIVIRQWNNNIVSIRQWRNNIQINSLRTIVHTKQRMNWDMQWWWTEKGHLALWSKNQWH